MKRRPACLGPPRRKKAKAKAKANQEQPKAEIDPGHLVQLPLPPLEELAEDENNQGGDQLEEEWPTWIFLDSFSE